MNSHTSSLSSLDNRYTFSCLGINLSFVSITWFYNFLVGILSLCFFPNTWIHLSKCSSTSFFTSSSSSQIFYSFATFFNFIVLFFLDFLFFIYFLLLLFSSFSFFFLFFFLFLLLPPWLFLLQSPLLLILFWPPCYFHFSCSPINFRIMVSES